jgi:hypothetical protein
VTAMDVVYALKRQGRTLYGFGGWFSWRKGVLALSCCLMVFLNTTYLERIMLHDKEPISNGWSVTRLLCLFSVCSCLNNLVCISVSCAWCGYCPKFEFEYSSWYHCGDNLLISGFLHCGSGISSLLLEHTSTKF